MKPAVIASVVATFLVSALIFAPYYVGVLMYGKELAVPILWIGGLVGICLGVAELAYIWVRIYEIARGDI